MEIRHSVVIHALPRKATAKVTIALGIVDMMETMPRLFGGKPTSAGRLVRRRGLVAWLRPVLSF